jgi:exodeoxyribonuclease-3
VVSGDYNVAHTTADIKNWKGNVGKAGFHEDERAYFDKWFSSKIGVVDLGRLHAGDVDGPYTWWSQRGQAFDTNTGWRIDYHVSDSVLAKQLTDVRIDKAASYAERWSDHAPVTVVFDL